MFPRNLDELRELALTSFTGGVCALGPHRSVLLTHDVLEQLRLAPDHERLVKSLATLPCPVIGVGTEPPMEPDSYAVCDVVVTSDFDLSTILTNIERSPLAAMVLVQVLRATSVMPIAEGLTLESLAYGTLQAGPENSAWLRSRKSTPRQVAESRGPPLLMERHDERLDVKLNRPATFNALSVELRDALCEALQLVLSDDSIRAVSVSGEGRCFSIGGDLDEFGRAPDPATAHAVRSVRLPASFLSRCAERAEFRLHGACIGAGIELPAFARRVTAAPDAFFQLPELRFGLIPGAGGCVSIPRRIGRQRTAYLALSMRRISAAKALQWGLIDALLG